MRRRGALYTGSVTGSLALGVLLAGCAGSRIDGGAFSSPKGYQVRLPGPGWQVEAGASADLELRRGNPPGGMLADATCGGPESSRSLDVLARHLTIGLAHRSTVLSDTWTVDGRPAAHRVVRGSRDGAEVAVEAVVLRGPRCVHDFLYVAPVSAFEDGRRDFKALVESFAEAAR